MFDHENAAPQDGAKEAVAPVTDPHHGSPADAAPDEVIVNSEITRTFILHNNVLAEQTLTKNDLVGTLAFSSTAYFCPHCGDVWGRIQYSHKLDWWDVIPRFCDKHAGDKWTAAMAGCFGHMTYVGEMLRWPREVLLHEVRMLATHAQSIRDETAHSPT